MPRSSVVLSSRQTTRMPAGMPGGEPANAQKACAYSTQGFLGGSGGFETPSATRGWRSAPVTFGLAASGPLMLSRSTVATTWQSGATPRSSRTRPRSKRIVTACGSFFDLSANTPRRPSAFFASAGSVTARRSCVAMIITSGVASSSSTTSIAVSVHRDDSAATGGERSVESTHKLDPMTGPAPLIGITAHETLVDDGVGVATNHHVTQVSYVKAVRKAG